MDKVAVSKYLSYLLRHKPEDLDISKDGFVPINQILRKLKEKFPRINKDFLQKVVEHGNKRFQIKNDRIRALYGHSIPVDIDLEVVDDIKTLYHGTTESAAESILKNGLKSIGRRKVHLSSTIKEAKRVGKRRVDNPVILKVDAENANKKGGKVSKSYRKGVSI